MIAAPRLVYAATAPRERILADTLAGYGLRIQASLSGSFTTDASKATAKRLAREAAQLAVELEALL